MPTNPRLTRDQLRLRIEAQVKNIIPANVIVPEAERAEFIDYATNSLFGSAMDPITNTVAWKLVRNEIKCLQWVPDSVAENMDQLSEYQLMGREVAVERTYALFLRQAPQGASRPSDANLLRGAHHFVKSVLAVEQKSRVNWHTMVQYFQWANIPGHYTQLGFRCPIPKPQELEPYPEPVAPGPVIDVTVDNMVRPGVAATYPDAY